MIARFADRVFGPPKCRRAAVGVVVWSVSTMSVQVLSRIEALAAVENKPTVEACFKSIDHLHATGQLGDEPKSSTLANELKQVMALSFVSKAAESAPKRSGGGKAKAGPKHLLKCNIPAGAEALMQTADWKDFSTGSVGWHANGKVLDSFGRTVQVNILMTVVDSKEAKAAGVPTTLAQAREKGLVSIDQAIKAGYSEDELQEAGYTLTGE